MKVKLKIDGLIVDEELAFKVFAMLSDHGEVMRKGWSGEKLWEFEEVTDATVCISPVNQAHYAEAVLNKK
jgi:hypothetical protein